MAESQAMYDVAALFAGEAHSETRKNWCKEAVKKRSLPQNIQKHAHRSCTPEAN